MMRRRGRSEPRRGTTMVEGAIVLGVFLTLVLGMLDLGMGVFRSHLVAAATRSGAREAMVRGALASRLGPWGPETVGPIPASDAHPLAEAIRPYLSVLDPATVTVEAEWPDGSNEQGQRVRVTVTTQYRPFMTHIFGPEAITLRAVSTMHVAH